MSTLVYTQIDNAKSCRSKCKKCKQYIPQNDLRIGKGSNAGVKSWYHLSCYPCKSIDPETFLMNNVTDNTKARLLRSRRRFKIIMGEMKKTPTNAKKGAAGKKANKAMKKLAQKSNAGRTAVKKRLTPLGPTSLAVPEFRNKSEMEISKLVLEFCEQCRDNINHVLPYCVRLVNSENQDVQENILYALSHATSGVDNETRIGAVESAGVTPFLVSLLGSESENIVRPALRTLGNFVSGDDAQTQVVIDENVLPSVAALLNHSSTTIQKEACWLLSNIAAGNASQISTLMSKKELIGKIVALARSTAWEVRREVAWTIRNIICDRGSSKGIRELCDLGAMEALFIIIADEKRSKTLMCALEAIKEILKSRQISGTDYTGLVDKCDGINRIEKLTKHPDEDVCRLAESCRGFEGWRRVSSS